MAKSMQQGSLPFVAEDSSVQTITLGTQMHDRGHVSGHETSAVSKGSGAERNAELAGNCARTTSGMRAKVASSRIEQVDATLSVSILHATQAYGQLTATQKEYLQHYCDTGSPGKVARRMGVKQSREVSKRLTKIARQLGYSGAKDMLVKLGLQPRQDAALPAELMQLLKSQNLRCAMSGVALSPTTARLDHKMAVSKGGSHLVENLQWVTDEVNRAKGTMTNDEFIGLCRLVTEHQLQIEGMGARGGLGSPPS